MRTVEPWDVYFMQMAELAATRSKDPSTQVGAVIVRDKRILASGYNGFPAGIPENPTLWERPTKYDYVVHAEANAIGDAARRGIAIDGTTMYLTAFPCNKSGCARLIIASGIRKVIAKRVLAGWDDDCRMTSKLFELAGLEWTVLHGNPVV
jgi:dCMP deaminase